LATYRDVERGDLSDDSSSRAVVDCFPSKDAIILPVSDFFSILSDEGLDGDLLRL